MIFSSLPLYAAATILTLNAAEIAPAPEETPPNRDEICAVQGDIARTVMTMRQKNAPISDLMAWANNAGDLAPLMRSLVLTAYDEPAYVTPANQQRAVDTFQNEVVLICYKAD